MPEAEQPNEVSKITSIQNLISRITSKIQELCDQRLNQRYISYLNDLLNDGALFMKREQFKKIHGSYQKLKKQLKSFQSTVIQDCSELMQIAIEIDLIRRRFDDLQAEFAQLKNSLRSNQYNENNDINTSLQSGQYLSILIQMYAKAQKVVDSHNNRVTEYNLYVSNFNSFITEFDRGYIIYTSPITDKSYSILLTDIVNEILALISPHVQDEDNLNSRRQNIFEIFEAKYNNELSELINESKLENIVGLNELMDER